MKKKIFAISGSTRLNSSNVKLIRLLAALTTEIFEITIFEGLDELPHFNPDLDNPAVSDKVKTFRQQINEADGVIICSPEYVFSMPGSLKNALEWCVSTTVFSGKPLGIITAAASGEKAHEQLKLVLKTIETKFNQETTLLIQGIKGKMDADGNVKDPQTLEQIGKFILGFEMLVNSI